MAKIFKPRRGKKSTMAGTKKATVLSAGEMFIEVPDTGAGTGHSKMKIGDGSTQYSSLPYAMGDTENDKIAFSNDTSGNITTALNKVTSGAALKTMIAALKQAVSLANTSITQLNDESQKLGYMYDVIVADKITIASHDLVPCCNGWFEKGIYFINTQIRATISTECNLEQFLWIDDIQDPRGSSSLVLGVGNNAQQSSYMIEVTAVSSNVVVYTRQYSGADVIIDVWMFVTRIK